MDLTEAELDIIRGIRDRGFAIAIFTPEELGNVPADHIEDGMIECGWEAIQTLQKDWSDD